MKVKDGRATGFRQCLLKRGNVTKIAWIPERFSRPGGYVRLFDVDGWLVVEAWMWLPDIALHHGYFTGGITHA